MAHSKLSVVKMDSYLGLLTTISTYCNMCEVPVELDLLKSTTYGAGVFHSYENGFGDGKVSLGGPWTRALDNFMSPIQAGFLNDTLTSVSFEYGPEGTDTGDVKYTMELKMKSYSGPKGKIEALLEWTAEFQVSASYTVGAY